MDNMRSWEGKNKWFRNVCLYCHIKRAKFPYSTFKFSLWTSGQIIQPKVKYIKIELLLVGMEYSELMINL